MKKGLSSPWAYRLDYDKEIAEDEKLIAKYSLHLGQGWTADRLPGWAPGAWVVTLADLVCSIEGVAASLGFSQEDVRDLRWYATDAGIIGKDVPEGDYWWGKALHAQLQLLAPDWLEGTTDQLRIKLKGTKLALARHRRNKAKYGK